MRRYEYENAVVKVYGKPNKAELEKATKLFLKRIMKEEFAKSTTPNMRT